MSKKFLLLTVLMVLLVSPVFAQNAFVDFVESWFDVIISLALFTIAFSLVFPVLSHFTDNLGAMLLASLSFAGIVATSNLMVPEFNELLYNFLFNVPYGLLVLLGAVIIVNLIFNKDTTVKIISSIVLGVLFVVVLLSNDLISVNFPAQEEPTSATSVTVYAIIGVIVLVVVGLIIWKMNKNKKEKKKSGGLSWRERRRQKKKAKKLKSIKSEIETPTEISEVNEEMEGIPELAEKTNKVLKEYYYDLRDVSRWFKKLYKLAEKTESKNRSVWTALKLILYGRFFTGIKELKGVEHYVPGLIHSTKTSILSRAIGKNKLLGRRLLTRIIPREQNRRIKYITNYKSEELDKNSLLFYLKDDYLGKPEDFFKNQLDEQVKTHNEILKPYRNLFKLYKKEESRRPSFKHLFSGKLKTKTSIFLPRMKKVWKNTKNLLVHNHSFTNDYEITFSSYQELKSSLKEKIKQFYVFLKEMERIGILGIDPEENKYFYVSLKTPYINEFINKKVSIISHFERINVPIEYLTTQGIPPTVNFIIKTLKDSVKKQKSYKNYDWEGLSEKLTNLLKANVNNFNNKLKENKILFQELYQHFSDLALLVRSARLYYKSLKHLPFEFQTEATLNFKKEEKRIKFLSHLHLFLNYSRDYGDPIRGKKRFYFNRRIFYKILTEYFINIRESYTFSDDFKLREDNDSFRGIFESEEVYDVYNLFRSLNNKVFNFNSQTDGDFIGFMKIKEVSSLIIFKILKIFTLNKHPSCEEEKNNSLKESLKGEFKELYDAPFDFIYYLLSENMGGFFDIYVKVVYEYFKKICVDKKYGIEFIDLEDLKNESVYGEAKGFFEKRMKTYSKDNGFSALSSYASVKGRVLFMSAKNTAQVIKKMYKKVYDVIFENLASRDVCFQCGAELKKKSKCENCGSLKKSRKAIDKILMAEVVRLHKEISKELRKIEHPILNLPAGDFVEPPTPEVIKTGNELYQDFVNKLGFEKLWMNFLNEEAYGELLRKKKALESFNSKIRIKEKINELEEVFELLWKEYEKIRKLLITKRPEYGESRDFIKEKLKDSINTLNEFWPNFSNVELSIERGVGFERTNFEKLFSGLLFIELGFIDVVYDKILELDKEKTNIEVGDIKFNKADRIEEKFKYWFNVWTNFGKEADNLTKKSDIIEHKRILKEYTNLAFIDKIRNNYLKEELREAAWNSYRGDIEKTDKFREVFEVLWEDFNKKRDKIIEIVKDNDFIIFDNENFYFPLIREIDDTFEGLGTNWVNFESLNLKNEYREVILLEAGFVKKILLTSKKYIDKDLTVPEQLKLKNMEKNIEDWKKYWKSLGEKAILLRTKDEEELKEKLESLNKNIFSCNNWNDILKKLENAGFKDFVEEFDSNLKKGYILDNTYLELLKNVLIDVIRHNISSLDDFLKNFINTCLTNKYIFETYTNEELKEIKTKEDYEIFRDLVKSNEKKLEGAQ